MMETDLKLLAELSITVKMDATSFQPALERSATDEPQ